MTDHRSRAFLLVFFFVALMLAAVYGLLIAAMPAALAAPNTDSCFIDIDNDDTTDYSSPDASALQTAVNAVAPGTAIRVAGTCAGVQNVAGITQTVYISKALTLQGGYSMDWSTYNPISYPTTLDAQDTGRVVYILDGLSIALQDLIIKGGNSVNAGGPDSGSGIYVPAGAQLLLSGGQVVSNTNGFKGTGIRNNGILTVTGAIIAHNSGHDGAAFANYGTMTVQDSAVFSNTANSDGGVLQNFGATAFINSTLSGNSAGGNGGAIEHWNGTLWLIHTTVADNRGGAGDGIFIRQVMTATHTIFDNGTDDNCRHDASVTTDIFNDGGFNIENSDTCEMSATSSMTDTDPLLVELADNGGDTWTHALQPGSPALDAIPVGENGCGSSYLEDQRGYDRPYATGDCDVGAFEARSFTLTVATAGTGLGSISGSGIDCGLDCTESYPEQTKVTLTATADTGSSFAGWSGACANNAGDCAVTMDQAQEVTATFTLNQYALTVVADGNGTVTSRPAGIDCGSDCSEDYDYGTTVTLTATADTGSAFAGWSGACANNAGDCAVTMDQAQEVTATFAFNQYALTVVVDGNGTVTSQPAGIDCGSDCSEDYDYGTTVTLTATADTGSAFAGWSGACSNSAGDCAVTMDQALGVTAMFTIDETGYALYLPIMIKP